MTDNRPGASPAEWAHFARLYPTDLLPVVSNPAAEISPDSKMKALGKTPSVYNRSRKVAGLPGWTERRSTAAEVAAWSQEPDYGICVQTRRVRAIDVDVDDPALAGAIENWLLGQLWLHETVSIRRRGNSGKVLLPVEVAQDDPMPKRRVRVEGGVVELLADGQQFVACGTHPSGVRYVWDVRGGATGLPEFPVLQPADLTALWDVLVATFGVEDESVSRVSAARPVRSAEQVNDPVVDHLEREGWARSWQADGRVNIRCPWQAEHTSDSGDTETQYFPAGLGEFQQGHFKCLHAHCMARTDVDFLDAVGYRAAQFAVVEHIGDTGEADPFAWLSEGGEEGAVSSLHTDVRGAVWALDEADWPKFERSKNGAILPTLNNIVMGVSSIPFVRCEIAVDDFKDIICVRGAGPEGVRAWGADWRPFTDADYTRLRMAMTQRGFDEFSKDTIKEVVHAVAVENHFDSAVLWLEKLAWDGKPRLRTFCREYLSVDYGAYPSGYPEAVGEYLWTALAGRVLSPGCWLDMVPVLIGEQGMRKTTFCRTIPPSDTLYAEINLNERDDNLSRLMRGKVVGEIGELRGLHTADAEAIKQWITRQSEEWVPKYKEFTTVFPRRLVFIGTSNKDEFLADPTGERRWLPLRVGACDIDGLRRDREQLWAEGAHRWREGGVAFREAERLAKPVHEEHKIDDPWTAEIEDWLAATDGLDGSGTPNAESLFALRDVLVGALGFRAGSVKRMDQDRAAACLRKLGYARVHTREGKRWRKNERY